MSIPALHCFSYFNIKYFESDSVKQKSHHCSFHVLTSIGVTGTKALLILERLFGSQWDGQTKADDAGKNLTMAP